MATLARRPRLVAAILFVAALGGLAAGIAVARGGSHAPTGPAGVVARGTFRTITWTTSGTATLVRDSSGRLTLRLGKSFSTKRSPDTWVYLARYEGSVRSGRRSEWKLIGPLRRAWGTQRFRVPAEAARPGMSIAIFCGKCGRLSGIARLHPSRARA